MNNVKRVNHNYIIFNYILVFTSVTDMEWLIPEGTNDEDRG